MIAVLTVMFLSGIQSVNPDSNFHPLGDIATNSHARSSTNGAMIFLAG